MVSIKSVIGKRILVAVAVALALLFAVLFEGCAVEEQKPIPLSFGTAWTAFMQFDLPGAFGLFERVAIDPNIDTKEKVNAMTKLAVMEWQFNKDIEKARGWVDKALSQVLWEKLHFVGTRPVFSDELFKKTLWKKFGTVINFGQVGQYSLAMGHVVVDDHRTVVQYGQEAKVAYIALDNMVSCFYTSWFWDGAAASGGWAEPDANYQVRQAVAMIPFYAWRTVSDPVERAKMEERIQKKSARDDDLAMKNPHAYLPGLWQRLELAGLYRILQTIDKKGYEGSARCLAFVNEYKRIQLGSTFFAHEGRHSIDQRMHTGMGFWKLKIGGFNYWPEYKMGFYAKLSEIAFAPDPQMACLNIINNNIGDDTGHGKANLMVVEKLVDWMDRHRKEITGLSPDRPLLPQFDLLTGEQIRSAVQSVDPLYLKAQERSKI